MSKIYVSLDKLSYFFTQLKNEFAPITHTHKVGDIENFTMGDAVLYTPQNLTEEQKSQARANIGINNNNNNNNNEYVPGTSVTTDMEYTYDGDYTTDANTWITNYGNIRMFVKLGDIPNGELNLVGATITAVNPGNKWLNYSVEITEDHLTDVVNKANVDIPATTPGLIQIYNQHLTDTSKFTILCICTKAGWYDVTFDDWYEIINFPETGIYGYDKRTYGGNEYVESFKFTVTTTTGNNGENSSNGSSSITTLPTKYTGKEIQMFSRGICIGDSVTEGSFDNNEGGAIINKFSYPSILKRLTNIDIVNAGIAGMTSKTWYEASLNSDNQWGKWVNNEWVWNMYPTVTGNDIVSSTLDYSNFDFAIIHLGINDIGLMVDSTIEEVLNSFEININNIISKLKTSSNEIKIFLATIVPSYAPSNNMTYRAMNERIKNIVEATNNVYLLDLNTYSEIASNENYNRIHPTALGYHKLATEIASYISYIINKNLDDFNAVQFIGTNYTL